MIAAACVVVFAGATAAGALQPIERVDRDVALRLFHERVEKYAALHRRLEGPLPPLTPTRETLKNAVARQLLANALRKARPHAQQGDIFSSDIACVFRAIISDALKGQDVEAFLAELNEEHPEMHHLKVAVNAPLPRGATHECPRFCCGSSRRCRKMWSTGS